MSDPRFDRITVSEAPASDGWGFVGVVQLGELEVYRTLQSYVTPGEGSKAAAALLADVLGQGLAAREWQQVKDRGSRVPRRTDLRMGLLGSRTPSKRRVRDL